MVQVDGRQEPGPAGGRCWTAGGGAVPLMEGASHARMSYWLSNVHWRLQQAPQVTTTDTDHKQAGSKNVGCATWWRGWPDG